MWQIKQQPIWHPLIHKFSPSWSNLLCFPQGRLKGTVLDHIRTNISSSLSFLVTNMFFNYFKVLEAQEALISAFIRNDWLLQLSKCQVTFIKETNRFLLALSLAETRANLKNKHFLCTLYLLIFQVHFRYISCCSFFIFKLKWSQVTPLCLVLGFVFLLNMKS